MRSTLIPFYLRKNKAAKKKATVLLDKPYVRLVTSFQDTKLLTHCIDGKTTYNLPHIAKERS